MANTLKLQDVLTKDELRELSKPSDIKAVLILAGNLAMVVGAFALAIQWPNPLTILFAVLVLGGRQLGLGVINHDCAHHAFFSSKWMNEFVGHWIAGAPINTSVHAYRAYHLKHHQHAGTQEDPDRWMVKDYPLAPERLRRKLMRDVTGQTGFRDTMRQIKAFSLKKNLPWLSFHVVLLTALTVAGAPWAYLLWWAASLFVFPVIVRIRQISEHGVASDRDSLDPRENTGTTLIGWWEKLFVGPNHVNYHLEHHHFPAVPPYNLRRLHELLKARGYYDGYDCVAHGYWDVLKRAMVNTPVPQQAAA